MSRITHNLLAKTIAIFLFVITGVLLTGSVVSIVYMTIEGFYSSGRAEFAGSYWEESVSSRYADKAYYDYYFMYQQIQNEEDDYELLYRRAEKQFRSENTNFRFIIRDENNEVLFGNCTEQEFRDSILNPYEEEFGEYIVETPDSRIYYRLDIMPFQTLLQDMRERYGEEAQVIDNRTIISYGMQEPVTVTDDYFVPYKIFRQLYQLRYWAFAIAVVELFILISSLIFLMCSAGHRKGQEEVHANVQDRIPLDFYLCIMIGLSSIVVILFVEAMGGLSSFITIAIAILLMALICFSILIAVLMSVANRMKLGHPLRNTICFFLLRFCWRIVKKSWNMIVTFFRNLPVIWRTVIAFGAIAFFNLTFTLILIASDGELVFFALLWFVLYLIVFAIVMVDAIQFSQLEQGAKNLSEGKQDYRIQSGSLFGHYRKFADYLNNIGDGIEHAVDIQVKSERMKAELITNVSHDIKTPLTSIINYVDLLKKQDISDETTLEYISILERQSGRLKKLTEDLVEASKASTGNISVEIAPTDVVELLNQSVAEYSERLEENGLQPVINAPEESAVISADGRLLWRIYDNLLSNICKYSQPQTRVYFDVVPDTEKVSIAVKNISREVLNISADELKERFVRGDSARHTEGSGLGLSIAESLTELNGGRFELIVDGDLFKVKLTFPRIIQSETT